MDERQAQRLAIAQKSQYNGGDVVPRCKQCKNPLRTRDFEVNSANEARRGGKYKESAAYAIPEMCNACSGRVDKLRRS